MKERVAVLLVSDQEAIYRQLKSVLEKQGVQVRVAHYCAQVQNLLKQFALPAVIFSDTTLPDGSWADVLDLASLAQRPVPLIVVSRIVNINLYIGALERGATDFVVPPFYCQDIAHVLGCAVQNGPGISDLPAWTLTAA